MSRMGNSVTGCASHFIYSRYRFGSVILTNILDTLRHRKGTFVRCHSALHQSREYITDFDCKNDQKGGSSCFCSMLSLALFITLPLPLLSLRHLPYTLIPYACRFVRTSLCVCWICYQKQRAFWHLLIGQWCWVFISWKSNCNLTVENSTPAVSALYVL